MTTKIRPQEFHFSDTTNDAVIKTVVARELLDNIEIYISHVRHMRMVAGDALRVQVMNESKDVLLHEAEFRITAAVETQHGIEDDYGSRVRPQTTYKIERKSDWWSSAEGEEIWAAAQAVIAPPRIPEEYVPGEATLHWHPGKKVWEVIVAGEVWTTVERKDGEGKEDYKARALAIAAGSEQRAA